MRMETKLKVITLNCWGLVWISKHRKERFAAIAQHLSTSDYDFVFLQEIWTSADFELIRRKTLAVLPHSHYFHSGVIGSGVCIFSKSPITDVAQHKFSLNGHAHKFQHGDWFGGKVVGMCRTSYRGLNINLYVTHLHAEYDRFHDQYLSHRIAQAFELSQFIRLTSETADLSILGGDLNTEPQSSAYQIIVHNTGFVDAFLEQPPVQISNDPTDGATCSHPRNPYTSRVERKLMPNGQRIDYILYKCSVGTSVQCLSCAMPLERIPGYNNKVPYSDHEAVITSFNMYKSMEARGTPKLLRGRIAALEDGIEILLAALKALKGDRLFYLVMSCLLLCLLLVTLPFHQFSNPIHCLLIFVRVVLSILLGFSVWMAFVIHRMECNATISAQLGMQLVLKAIQPLDEQDIKRDDNMLFRGSSDTP